MDQLQQCLEDFGFGGNTALRALARPAVRLVATPTTMEGLAIGQSRLGGVPDLPRGMAWPERKGAPLTPLCMLNLQDVSLVIPKSPLPTSGWLVFWYDGVEEPWGYLREDHDGFRVEYIPVDSPPLVRSAAPESFRHHEDATTNEVYTPCTVQVSLVPTMPSWLEELNWTPPIAEDEIERYEEFLEDLRDIDASNGGHTVLGYPWVVQSAMRSECECLERGFDCGSAEDLPPNIGEIITPGLDDWILLAQFDTDEDGPCWMWGDVGVLYFWIRKQDLAERRFDRVRGILQCG